METLKRNVGALLAGTLLGFILCTPVALYSQDENINARIPEGVYIKLTKDFYEALQNQASRKTKVYTNNPADDYLKQIAVSTKFMVETNLEMLKQQERMNQMLESLLRDKSN